MLLVKLLLLLLLPLLSDSHPQQVIPINDMNCTRGRFRLTFLGKDGLKVKVKWSTLSEQHSFNPNVIHLADSRSHRSGGSRAAIVTNDTVKGLGNGLGTTTSPEGRWLRCGG
jgi:hypothetical protein